MKKQAKKKLRIRQNQLMISTKIFPFVYKSETGILYQNNISENKLKDLITDQLKESFGTICSDLMIDSNNTIIIKCNRSLLKINYIVHLNLFTKGDYLVINYNFFTSEILQFTFFMILISFFVGLIANSALLFPLLILSVLFFMLNVLYINTTIRNILHNIPFFKQKDIIFLENNYINTLLKKKRTYCEYCNQKILYYDFICFNCKSINHSAVNNPATFTKYQEMNYRYVERPKSDKT